MPKVFASASLRPAWSVWLVTVIGLLCMASGALAAKSKDFPLFMGFTHAGVNHNLHYTGSSERVILIFRVYEIAHYAEASPTPFSPESLIDDGPAKAIAITFSRKLGRDQIRDELDRSLRKNAQPGWLEDAQGTISAFMASIDRDAQKGDQLIFYWLSGGRIFAEFNGEPAFTANDTAFAKLIWSIWFGKEPACDIDALLAQSIAQVD
ncbi:chalcone isomerase family protein [Congregibacter litoralis]|uniref:Chalcone-flavanone isomerase n=1 Tax=Congregibacter litoralis KT71 TaxID=314285 RepID=A4A4T6_9GAMM|nr:chalcone isomerase family protein [Congregibacter litoralis]EAQ98807.2 Chalcone-flavanone isomerase [Congregibacter litoralis KT71]